MKTNFLLGGFNYVGNYWKIGGIGDFGSARAVL